MKVVCEEADLRLSLSQIPGENKDLEGLTLIDDMVQTTDADIKSIERILASLYCDNPLIVEIGTWVGHMTVHMGKYAKANNGMVMAVDNFKGTGSPLEEVCKNSNPREMLEQNLKAFKVNDYVTIKEGDSPEISKQFEDNSIDLVFIDGDHRYSSVVKDIKSWFPKVKKGGFIAGHDYTGKIYSEEHLEVERIGWLHHGVNKAVSTSFWAITLFPDSVWCSRKTEE